MKSLNLPVSPTDFFTFTFTDYGHVFEAFEVLQNGLLKALGLDSQFIVLSGLVWTVTDNAGITTFSSTEGFVIFGGELYFCPSQNLSRPTAGTTIPVFSVFAENEPEEPRQLSGGAGTIAIRQNRILRTTLGASGSGISDYDTVLSLENTLLDLSSLNISNRLLSLEEDTKWINVTSPTGGANQPLLNGWVNPSAAFNVRYRKIQNRVYLSGGIRGGAATSSVVFQLPLGFRPQRVQSLPYGVDSINANEPIKANIGAVLIDDGGDVQVFGFGGFSWGTTTISLDGVNFLID